VHVHPQTNTHPHPPPTHTPTPGAQDTDPQDVELRRLPGDDEESGETSIDLETYNNLAAEIASVMEGEVTDRSPPVFFFQEGFFVLFGDLETYSDLAAEIVSVMEGEFTDRCRPRFLLLMQNFFFHVAEIFCIHIHDSETYHDLAAEIASVIEGMVTDRHLTCLFLLCCKHSCLPPLIVSADTLV